MRVIFFILSLIMVCEAWSQSPFDLQGHRGARGLMPENTWPSIKMALDLGVRTIEIDVVITRDSQVVLSHEPWFSHKFSIKPGGDAVTPAEETTFNIFRMNYSEVMGFDVGSKGNPDFPEQHKMPAVKPLLSSVFDSVINYLKFSRRPFPYFNIEVKSTSAGDHIFHPDPLTFVTLVMKVVAQHNAVDYVSIQSFDYRVLKMMHRHFPSVPTGLLTTRTDVPQIINELGFIPSTYSPIHTIVTKELVDSAHHKGMRIVPWTVNDKERMRELINLGVDGLITDFPNLFYK